MQKFLGLSICLSAVISFVPTVAFSLPLSGNQTLNNLAEKAKLEVSKTTGISADRLSVANKATLADTGITRFKLIDTQGNIYGVSLDAAGNQISQEVLEQAVQAINNKGFVGKLEAELANRISQGSNSPIRVVFYLKGKTVKPYRGSNRTEYQNHFNTLKSHYEAIQQPLVNQLKESNQRIIYQNAVIPHPSIRWGCKAAIDDCICN